MKQTAKKPQENGKRSAPAQTPAEKPRLSDNKRTALWCAAACLLAAACCLAAAIVQKLVPFGTNRRIFADLYLEYWPYLTELHDKLHGGGSVFYSWAGAMGGSFFGILCHYLLSPFNAILLLLPRAAIPAAIPVLTSLRQCLAAGAMAAFLCLRKNGRPGAAAAAGGVLYAFCGWFVSYSYNIIWQDVFFLLPLLALGVETIILSGRVKLFAVSLTLSLLSNFYLAWFAALFAVIYFLGFYFSHYGLLSPFAQTDAAKVPFFRSRFWHAGLRFAGAAFVSAAVLGALFVPLALLLLSATPENTFAESYATLFRELPRQAASLLSGSNSFGVNTEATLSVYSGVLPLAAVPLLPFLKSVGKKEKWITFGLLLFFVLSFNLPFLDYAWHGFRTITGVPFRQAFLFSFFLIAAAHRAVTAGDEIPGRAWLAAGGTGLAVAALAGVHLATAETPVISVETLSLSAAAFLVYLAALAAYLKKDRRLRAAAAALLLLTAGLDAFNHAARNPQIIPADDYAALTGTYDGARELVGTFHSDTPFFRTNLRFTDMSYGNYGAQTGLKGIYQSASVAETNYGFFRKLGLDTNESNYVLGDLQSPAFNSLFGVKYTVESDAFVRQGETPNSLLNCAAEGYTKIADTGSVRLYRYDYALPAGFVADGSVKNWELQDHAAPENQNAFFRLAANAEDILTPAAVAPAGTATEGASLTQAGPDAYDYAYTAPADGENTAHIAFNVTPAVSGQLYLYVDMHNEKFSAWGVSCTLNGAKMNFTQENNTLFTSVGNATAGETCQIEFLCRTDTAGTFTLQAYTSVPANAAQAYETLRENGFWQLDACTDTRLSGTVNVTRPEAVFCTSVPAAKGWHVTVDGRELPREEILAVGGDLLGFEISPGTHDVTLEYRQPGLAAGLAVSAAGVLAAAVWVVADRRKRSRA